MMDVEDVIKGRSGSKGNARGFQIPSGARAKGAEKHWNLPAVFGTPWRGCQGVPGGARGFLGTSKGFQLGKFVNYYYFKHFLSIMDEENSLKMFNLYSNYYYYILLELKHKIYQLNANITRKLYIKFLSFRIKFQCIVIHIIPLGEKTNYFLREEIPGVPEGAKSQGVPYSWGFLERGFLWTLEPPQTRP